MNCKAAMYLELYLGGCFENQWRKRFIWEGVLKTIEQDAFGWCFEDN
jgi:hypothetical protein